MSNPVGAALSSTQLFISDRGNNRIEVWTSWPTVSGQARDVYLGQAAPTDESSNQGSPTAAANTLSSPHFMISDGCRLFVVDQGNHRVLIY